MVVKAVASTTWILRDPVNIYIYIYMHIYIYIYIGKRLNEYALKIVLMQCKQ